MSFTLLLAATPEATATWRSMTSSRGDVTWPEVVGCGCLAVLSVGGACCWRWRSWPACRAGWCRLSHAGGRRGTRQCHASTSRSTRGTVDCQRATPSPSSAPCAASRTSTSHDSESDSTYVKTYIASTRGGYRILQGRVSNPSERGTGGRASKAPRECGLARKMFVFLISKWCFYAYPLIFIDTVTYKKGTLIKRAGVRTPWTLSWIRPCPPHHHWVPCGSADVE